MTALAILALALVLAAPPAESGRPGRRWAGTLPPRARIRAQFRPAAPTAPPADSPAAAADPAPGFDTAATDPLRNDAWLHDLASSMRPRLGRRRPRHDLAHRRRRTQLGIAGIRVELPAAFRLLPRADMGWAAGGCSQPYTRTPVRRRAGHARRRPHWFRDPGLLLPALKQVRFFEQAAGWALGNSSAMFPGGRVRQPRRRAKLDAPGRASLAAGPAATFSTPAPACWPAEWRDGRRPPGRLRTARPTARSEAFRQLRLARPPYAWLVGEGGECWPATTWGAMADAAEISP